MAIEDQAVPESLYRNAINLNRYQTSVSKKLINRYNDIIVELTNELRNTDIELTAARQLRISTILRQLEESLGTWAIDATNVTKDELQGLAALQSDFIQEQLKKVLPSDEMKSAVRTVEISPQFAQSVVTTDPARVNVFTLPEELQATRTGIEPKFSLTAKEGAIITLPNGATVQTSFRRIAASQHELLSKTVNNGLLIGRTTQEISRELRGRLDFEEVGTLASIKQKGGVATKLANNQIETIVRTSINQVSNSAAIAVYRNNSDITDRYRYVATLDTRTSPICSRLDGQVFTYGKGPTPPQHFNCRSTTVPLVKESFLKQFGVTKEDFEEGAQRPSKTGLAQKGKMVPANENYASWLSKQPSEIQDEVFGKKKGVIYRSQLRKKDPTTVLREFVRSDGSELTLEELGRLNNAT
mgnify:FL=1|tara:strand:+ start:2181 stop:3422 length:1242 start_codon:yes stop_codon:yes gene_type:complete